MESEIPWSVGVGHQQPALSGRTQMAHLEILVEEPSAEAALQMLVPRMLGCDASLRIHPHQGKPDLLQSLSGRVRGYANWPRKMGIRVIVLLDEDREDCRDLKRDLERMAAAAGLPTKSAEPARPFVVVNRIAVEELEAWFFGDIVALSTAFPGVPATLAHKRAYRDPDAIRGGTWEALHRVLQRAGYYPTGFNKIEAARRVAQHMDPNWNRSRSFQVFRQALELAAAD